MALKYTQTNTFYQSGSGSIIGATSIVLPSFADIYGNVLTITDFGAKGYITLEPDTTNEESATFTGVTANANGTYSLTGVSTALAKSPYTETSGLVRQHSGGTKVVVSDTTAFWNTFTNKNNNETVAGIYTFSQSPIAPDPTTALQVANKEYVDAVVIAGGTNASSTVKGISKLSIDPVSGTNPIAVGDNDTRVPTTGQTASLVGNNTDIAVGSGNKMVTQTGLQHNAEKYAVDGSASATAYTATLSPVPASLTDGMEVYVKINQTNSGTAPTLNVNSLGAKVIKKLGNTALAIGDVVAGFNTFIYDLTNTVWIMQNPIANAPTSTAMKFGQTTRAVASGTGTQNIAHGLGKTPTMVQIFTNGQGTSGAGVTLAQSMGTGTASNNSCTWSTNVSGTVHTGQSGNIIEIFASDGTTPLAEATISALDSTNITLNFTTMSGTGLNIYIQWVVFG